MTHDDGALAVQTRPEDRPAPRRDVALDRIRGAAVALMLVDHLALWLDLLPLRLTVGRLALPLFFLLAGHLAGRLGRRTLHLVAAGLALTVLAPWAGSPSILLWIAFCLVVIVAARAARFPLWLLAAVPLTLAANRWPIGATGYDPAGLLALMALGALLPRSAFAWGHRLPALLDLPGRYALSAYVVHALALTLVFA